MKTTPKGSFIIICQNQAHLDAVQNRLKELGYSWAYGPNFRFEHSGPVMLFLREGGISWPATYPGKETRITLDDLYGEKFVGVSSVEVPLNADYKAVVTKEGIKVGCQSFPLSIVEALVEAKRKVLE